MLRPFLIVGVGGSGGKTLRVVRDDLVSRLDKAGWTGEFPAAWQFLHIDVPTVADGNDQDLPGQLPAGNYQGLVGTGVDYRTIDSALVQKGGAHLHDALGGWRPNPDKVNIPASRGAGQYRALGRIITIGGLDRVRDAVRRAHRSMTGTQVVAELQAATRVLGGEPAAVHAEPTVIVVSSIAGGSGSGAVIDVCDVIRSLDESWAEDIVGVLYAPDVFDYLPEEARRGVRPNSLAALSELLNGYWAESGASQGTAELFASHGVQVGASRRLGPRFPFLVGARNEAVTFQTQNDVYRALGKSLASWVTSETLQDTMSAYIQAQWSATASSVRDKMPMHSDGMEAPFVALGSARVSLGRDRFRDYSSQHLARAAIDRVLTQHEGSRSKDDDRPGAALVRDIATQSFQRFLKRSGLDERGAEQNQIIDALMPESTQERVRSAASQMLTKVRDGIDPKGSRAGDVSRAILANLHDQRLAFQRDQLAAQSAVAADWSKSIQKHLVTEVALTIAREGAPVTAELVRQLKTEVSQVRDELVGEAQQLRRRVAAVDQEVAGDLADSATAVILRETGSLKAAINRAAGSLLMEAQADVRDLSAEMIPDLVRNLVEPMLEAVEHGRERLESGVAESDDRALDVSTWPEGDLVPHHIKPAPNEFLLEPADNFPDLLRETVLRTVGGERPHEARATADIEVILGAEDIDAHGAASQTLLIAERLWVPRHERFHDSASAAPTPARFELASGPAQFKKRADAWVTRPGTAVGNLVAQGLRDYLDPEAVSPREHEARLDRFDGQLSAALNAAAPLVSINPSVLVQVHERHEIKYNLSFSEIPLPDRSPGKERVHKLLEARGQWTDKVAKAFTDRNGASIDIFTVLGEPYEPVVFDSLMKPIATEWGQRAAAVDTRAEFWRWRRARPLTEAVPFSSAMLARMVRGWFTASLLKQLDLETAARIYVPAPSSGSGDYRDFPKPLLTPAAANGPDLLPSILESFSLAMLEVNTTESLRPVDGYRRLADLGQETSAGADVRSGELRAWIVDGANTLQAAADPAGSWEARQAQALERLSKLRAVYADHEAKYAARRDLLDAPLSYELSHVTLAALADLASAVESMRKDDDGGIWN